MRTLSLVIPAYRSDGLIGRILSHVPALADAARASGFRLVEAIVVDDGSVPAVGAEAAAAARTVPVAVLRNERNRGKGFSVRRGALAAKGEWVLMSDADESVPLAEFAALAPHSDCAMVCGCRRPGLDERPLLRRVLSRVFNGLCGAGLGDSQCGFKLFNMGKMREAFERLSTDRFAFDVELIRRSPSCVAVPVRWHGARRSSLRVWRDAPRMLWDLVRIRISVRRAAAKGARAS